MRFEELFSAGALCGSFLRWSGAAQDGGGPGIRCRSHDESEPVFELPAQVCQGSRWDAWGPAVKSRRSVCAGQLLKARGDESGPLLTSGGSQNGGPMATQRKRENEASRREPARLIETARGTEVHCSNKHLLAIVTAPRVVEIKCACGAYVILEVPPAT